MEQYTWGCGVAECHARTRSGDALGYDKLNREMDMTQEDWVTWETHIEKFDKAHREAGVCGMETSWAWRP